MTKLDFATQLEQEAQETMIAWDIDELARLEETAEVRYLENKYAAQQFVGGF